MVTTDCWNTQFSVCSQSRGPGLPTENWRLGLQRAYKRGKGTGPRSGKCTGMVVAYTAIWVLMLR
jgi:hypothetical protein